MKTRTSITRTACPKTMVGFLRTACVARLPLLLLLALPAVVQAQYNYTTNNGTITITKYTGSGGAVAIPDTINGLPVTSIGYRAFYNQSSLTSATIGNSVTSIGDYAFSDCTSLASVTIHSSVTSIGWNAFGYCSGLTAITVDALNSFYSSVDGVLFSKSQTTLIQCPGGKAGSYTIPNNVASIGDEAFSDCTSLTSVTIPSSVTSIGDYAFSDCTSLASVTIHSSVTSIGWHAFEYCTNLTAITVDALNSFYSSMDGVLFDKSQTTLIQYPGGKAGSYTIPNSVTSIEVQAFSWCISLTSVTIPNSVTSIRCGAFDHCTSLYSVKIPNSVISIRDLTFYQCTSLTSVTIPDSVASVGSDAFSFCTSLTGVFFQGSAPSVGEDVFYGANNATVYYLPGTTGWGPTLSGRPTVLWNPQVQTSGSSFGVRTNQFVFTINWASGMVVVVEACTNLANPAWTPVGTNTLTGGSSYFSDPQWTNFPTRIYRLRAP